MVLRSGLLQSPDESWQKLRGHVLLAGGEWSLGSGLPVGVWSVVMLASLLCPTASGPGSFLDLMVPAQPGQPLLWATHGQLWDILKFQGHARACPGELWRDQTSCSLPGASFQMLWLPRGRDCSVPACLPVCLAFGPGFSTSLSCSFLSRVCVTLCLYLSWSFLCPHSLPPPF